MHVDATDHRPRSLFDRGGLTIAQLIAGAFAALMVHLGLPLVVLVIIGVLTAAGISLTPTPPEPPPVEQVIQARFVQLGEPLDPGQLPNRRVPILRTEVPEPGPSKRAPTEPPPPRTERERQPNAVPDLLQRLSDEAQIFAEREERRVQEGAADGIEGGERAASEGDVYAGRLSSFFRRGWQVPTTIARETLRTLATRVSVRIGEDLRVESYRVLRSSGNPDFDLSVEQQLQRLVDGQAVIPPPPDDIASNYLGREVGFLYNGRDAR